MTCPHCGTTFGTGEAMYDHVSQHWVVAAGLSVGLLLCGSCWHLLDASGCQCRFWCPLLPCNPQGAPRPDAAGSASFQTRAEADDHIRWYHFLNPKGPGVPDVLQAPRPVGRFLEGVRLMP